MVRKRALRNGCILVDADGCVRPAILDDGVLQFRHSVSAFGDSPTADDRRNSHCIVHNHRGHVAGAIPDHCALVGQQESAVQLGLLSSTAGRDHDHDCDVCRDGASVHAVFKGRTANLDLGTESRRASAARPQASGGGALGLVLGYLLASGTQRAWPLSTGGMPIVAMWPNIIIMFELTMLGAILATVISLFITTKLPTTKSRLYDIEVFNGRT